MASFGHLALFVALEFRYLARLVMVTPVLSHCRGLDSDSATKLARYPKSATIADAFMKRWTRSLLGSSETVHTVFYKIEYVFQVVQLDHWRCSLLSSDMKNLINVVFIVKSCFLDIELLL